MSSPVRVAAAVVAGLVVIVLAVVLLRPDTAEDVAVSTPTATDSPMPTTDPTTAEPAPASPVTLAVDGLDMEIRTACFDAQREETRITFGAEAHLEMLAGDPPVMTIGSEGFDTTSTDVDVSPGDPTAYEATFPEGNPYGATSARLVTVPQDLPAC